jgi:hypothetical protein
MAFLEHAVSTVVRLSGSLLGSACKNAAQQVKPRQLAFDDPNRDQDHECEAERVGEGLRNRHEKVGMGIAGRSCIAQ